MGIVYAVNKLLLIVVFCLLKRNDKKMDLFKQITITTVLDLCYNIVLSYANNLLNIPITLTTLTIENTVILAILSFIVIRKKEIQKYYIKIRDVIFLCVLILFTIGLIYVDHGIPMGMRAFGLDFMNHYVSVNKFVEKSELLGSSRPGFYINAGILFKMFKPYIEKFYLFKVIFIFDMCQISIIAAVFYNYVKDRAETLKSYIPSTIVILISVLTYPLNSLLSGFTYLTLALGIILTEILVIESDENNELVCWEKYLYLFLLNFAALFSYYSLMPPVFLAMAVYFISKWVKNKEKIFSKEHIIFVLFAFIIPALCCLQFHFLVRFVSVGSGTASIKKQVTTEGFIYKGIYANFIFQLPFIVFYLYKKIKEKKFNYTTLLFVSTFLYIAGTSVLMIFKIISQYAFFKTYYIFGMLIYYMFVEGFLQLLKEEKAFKISAICMMYFFIAMVIVVLVFGNATFKKGFIEHEGPKNAFDILQTNKYIMKNVAMDYNQPKLKMLKYVYDNIDYQNDDITLVGNERENALFGAVLDIPRVEPKQVRKNFMKWLNDEKFEYLIVFYKTNNKNFKAEDDLIYKNATEIFKTSEGVILKKNNVQN